MTTLLRILRLYPLALWVGGEVFFVIVAGISFSVLPNPHTAGLVVRSALIDLHRIGIGAGIVYLIATLGLMATQRNDSTRLIEAGHRIRLVEIVVVAIMLLLTLYSQTGVIPRMEHDRISLGGDVAAAPAQSPARLDFDRLHKLSVNLEGAVLIGGLVLIAFAPVEGRSKLKGTS